MSTFLYYFDGAPLAPPPPRSGFALMARPVTMAIRSGSRILASEALAFGDSVDSSSILSGTSATSAQDRAYLAMYVAARCLEGHVPHLFAFSSDLDTFDISQRVQVSFTDISVRVVGGSTTAHGQVDASRAMSSATAHPLAPDVASRGGLCDLLARLPQGTVVSFGPLPSPAAAGRGQSQRRMRRR